MALSRKQKRLAMSTLGKEEITGQPGGTFTYSIYGVEVGDGRVLSGSYGRGVTLNAAIDQYWDELTTLQRTERVVVGAYTQARREYIWNGFMWANYQL